MKNNRIPKHSLGSNTAATEKGRIDALNVNKVNMDDEATKIAHSVTDMVQFLSEIATVLPNMELFTDTLRLVTTDAGMSIKLICTDQRRASRQMSAKDMNAADDYDDEEGNIYDGD